MPPSGDPEESVDLHGLTPDQALRRVAQGLHAARVRGSRSVRVITGRGWGNRTQTPILRKQVEAWLRGPDGKRMGVRNVRIGAKGGALDVDLG
ncbi:MAG: Smr/MutS family protein [Planctomycetota bacterium]